MKRYIGIYFKLLQLNFSAFTANRVGNFLAGIIGSLGWGVVSILSMFLLTAKTSSVYGWTRNEMLLMTGLYGIFIGLYHTIFSNNFERFSRIIHLGELDGVLLKPLDSQFFLSLWTVNYLSLLRVAFAICFSFIMIRVMNLSVSIFDILFFLLFFISGLITIYSLWYIIMTITVWFSNLTNLVDLLFNFTSIVRYPREAITQAGNVFLFVFIPIVFVISSPAKVLLHKTDIFDVIGIFFFAILLFLISRTFWKFALRFYTSASG